MKFTINSDKLKGIDKIFDNLYIFSIMKLMNSFIKMEYFIKLISMVLILCTVLLNIFFYISGY